MTSKQFLHKHFDLPLFDNQFQRDISFWVDIVRFKVHRRELYHPDRFKPKRT
jgi:hypothetical protein